MLEKSKADGTEAKGRSRKKRKTIGTQIVK